MVPIAENMLITLQMNGRYRMLNIDTGDANQKKCVKSKLEHYWEFSMVFYYSYQNGMVSLHFSFAAGTKNALLLICMVILLLGISFSHGNACALVHELTVSGLEFLITA